MLLSVKDDRHLTTPAGDRYEIGKLIGRKDTRHTAANALKLATRIRLKTGRAGFP